MGTHTKYLEIRQEKAQIKKNNVDQLTERRKKLNKKIRNHRDELRKDDGEFSRAVYEHVTDILQASPLIEPGTNIREVLAEFVRIDNLSWGDNKTEEMYKHQDKYERLFNLRKMIAERFIIYTT